jgi:hypothetical protein
MGRDLAEPDWLPLTDDELRGILGRSDPGPKPPGAALLGFLRAHLGG